MDRRRVMKSLVKPVSLWPRAIITNKVTHVCVGFRRLTYDMGHWIESPFIWLMDCPWFNTTPSPETISDIIAIKIWISLHPKVAMTGENISESPKIDSFQNANFVVISGTASLHNDNFRIRQWRQSWHHDNSWFSVYHHVDDILQACMDSLTMTM